jgi:hypothetical protein
MRGPFYVRDKDFQDREVYKLAHICEDCAFCDERSGFCCLSTCTYFEFMNEQETEENFNKENCEVTDD